MAPATVRRLFEEVFASGWAAPELTVRALAPLVLVVFTDMGRARCADPQLGWERYRELSVFVPVHGRRDGKDFTAVHVPFIYPDSARAMASGREHYGLPKKHAHAIALTPPTLTLDVMGAEHLLGKGDMLFLPPGSSRLVRVHGSYVSEGETSDVVDFWKKQAAPEYDQSFLIAPPSDASSSLRTLGIVVASATYAISASTDVVAGLLVV